MLGGSTIAALTFAVTKQNYELTFAIAIIPPALALVWMVRNFGDEVFGSPQRNQSTAAAGLFFRGGPGRIVPFRRRGGGMVWMVRNFGRRGAWLSSAPPEHRCCRLVLARGLRDRCCVQRVLWMMGGCVDNAFRFALPPHHLKAAMVQVCCEHSAVCVNVRPTLNWRQPGVNDGHFWRQGA